MAQHGNPQPRCGVHHEDTQRLQEANCHWHALAQGASPSPRQAGAIGLHWHIAMSGAWMPALEGLLTQLWLPAGSQRHGQLGATSGAAWLAHNPSMQEQEPAYGFAPAKF